MASISRERNGHWMIQFVAPDGKRKTIRLGKATRKIAEATKVKVERLVAARLLGHPVDDETARWVNERDDLMHGKLAAVGLVKPRQHSRMTLVGFVDDYIKSRTDAKPRTIINMKQARKKLEQFFGTDKLLRDVTEGEADEFQRDLQRKVGINTARRICGRAKQFFRAAIRRRLIQVNPFMDVKCQVQGNEEKQYFVSPEEARKVLDHCPDREWKLIFALSRYGGLRCPSEHGLLRVGDIDWENDRMTVRSPKTEHHEGKASRQVPIFPELRPHLLDACLNPPDGQEYLVPRCRDSAVNLRTQFRRIIELAGLEPWPKLFHNLRATRQTELAETYPIHVVCAWLGNSQAVAKKHYLQVTEEHFERATMDPKKALQNPVQYPAVKPGIGEKMVLSENAQGSDLPSLTDDYNCLPVGGLPPLGLEPRTH